MGDTDDSAARAESRCSADSGTPRVLQKGRTAAPSMQTPSHRFALASRVEARVEPASPFGDSPTSRRAHPVSLPRRPRRSSLGAIRHFARGRPRGTTLAPATGARAREGTCSTTGSTKVTCSVGAASAVQPPNSRPHSTRMTAVAPRISVIEAVRRQAMTRLPERAERSDGSGPGAGSVRSARHASLVRMCVRYTAPAIS